MFYKEHEILYNEDGGYMKKNRFLKELEKQLVDFDDKEKILLKYSKKIDQKIAKGLSELKAVSSLGSFEKIIQKEKKILLETKQEDEEVKEFFKQFDKFVKNTSVYVADQFKKMIIFLKEDNVSVEQIFEILIKSAIFMLIMLIPFQIIRGIISIISESSLFGPLSWISSAVLNSLVFVLYICLSVYILFRVFDETIRPRKASKKANILKQEKQLVDASIFIIKLMIILVAIPMMIAFIMSIFTLIATIYFTIVYVYIPGFIISSLALVIFLSYLLYVIYKFIFEDKDISWKPMMISLLLLVLGVLMSYAYIVNTPVKQVEYTHYKEITMLYYYPVYIHSKNVVIVHDSKIPINKISFKLTYNKDFGDYDILIDNSGSACELGAEVCNMMFVERHRIYVLKRPDFDSRIPTIMQYYFDQLKNNKNYNLNDLLGYKLYVHIHPEATSRINIVK
jgi:hypothetical protein